MLLLVTGASGSGKSTARRLAEPRLSPDVVCAELGDIVEIPAYPDHRWRQQAAERAVQYAIELLAAGRHLLLAGDPVAIGEVLAAPSATELNGIAAYLLDVDSQSQTERLTHRGDDPVHLPNHHGFADWMRGHIADPQHRQFVIIEGGWDAMRWDRWTGWSANDDRWRFELIDTSGREPSEVAELLVDWCRRTLSGDAPALQGQWWK